MERKANRPASFRSDTGRRGLSAIGPVYSESRDLPVLPEESGSDDVSAGSSSLSAAAPELCLDQRLPAMATGGRPSKCSLDVFAVTRNTSPDLEPPSVSSPTNLASQSLPLLLTPPATETVSDGDIIPPFVLDDLHPCLSPDEIKSKLNNIIAEFRLAKTKTTTNEVLAILNTARWINIKGDDFMRYQWRSKTVEYFVRPCYKDIYAIVDDVQGDKGSVHSRRADSRCTYITGTPGIGKSVFGFILCRMLLDRKKPTLLFYESPDMRTSVFWDGQAHFIDEPQAIELIQTLVERGLCSESSYDDDAVEVWSIGDSRLPIRESGSRQICITSPGDARFGTSSGPVKYWVKHNLARTLAMPPCTCEEILQMRTVQRNMSDQSLGWLRAKFDIWGGVPRTIFRTQETWVSEDFEDQEFRQMRVEDAITYLGTYNFDHQNHSGRIFHLYPCFGISQEEYAKLSLTARYSTGRARYYWASDALERKVWAYFRRQQESEVIEYIMTNSNDAGSRGKAFEEHIHQLIPTIGLKGRLIRLEGGEETENFCLKSRKQMFFTGFEDIDTTAEYWRPVASSNTSLDAYLPASGVMLQMTIGKTHSIKASGVEEALKSKIFTEWENSHPTERIKFIFVVDGENTEIVREQSLTFGKRQGKKRSGRTSSRQKAIDARIEQYILEVDLEARLRELRCIPSRKRGRSEDEEPPIIVHRNQGVIK